MRWNRIAVAVAACVLCACGSARADSCSRSRDYILQGPSGDLPRQPQAYQELFKECMASLQLSNVKNAFILKAGAVAVVPSRDTLSATAETLAQFCTRFPHGTLRFVTRKELPVVANMARAVRISSANSGACEEITGRR